MRIQNFPGEHAPDPLRGFSPLLRSVFPPLSGHFPTVVIFMHFLINIESDDFNLAVETLTSCILHQTNMAFDIFKIRNL